MKKISVYTATIFSLFIVPLYGSYCTTIVSFMQIPDKIREMHQGIAYFDDRGEEVSVSLRTDLDLYRKLQSEKAQQIKKIAGETGEDQWAVKDRISPQYIDLFASGLSTDDYAVSGGYLNSEGSIMPLYQILINEDNARYLLPLMRYMWGKNFTWTSFNDDAVSKFVKNIIPFGEKYVKPEAKELLHYMRETYSLDTRGNNYFESIVFKVTHEKSNAAFRTDFFSHTDAKRKRQERAFLRFSSSDSSD